MLPTTVVNKLKLYQQQAWAVRSSKHADAGSLGFGLALDLGRRGFWSRCFVDRGIGRFEYFVD